MTDEEMPKKGWGCLPWIVVVIVILSLASSFVPQYGGITVTANQVRASANARQIIGLLQTWAREHEGYYPDHGLPAEGLTSNEVFHRLFKDGIAQDERLFGCPGSRFNPDTHLGEAPDYGQALKSWENHWAMVGGMRIDSLWRAPLVFENPVDDTWPPTWLIGAGVKPLKGRAHPGDTIVLGCNDGSVNVIELKEKAGRLHLPDKMLRPRGLKPLSVMRILDITPTGSVSYEDNTRGPGTMGLGAGGLPPLPFERALSPSSEALNDDAAPSAVKPD